MPRYKVIPSLYHQCLKILYNIIYGYCSNLDLWKVSNAGRRLKLLHKYLLRQFPLSVLNDLLEVHNAYGHNQNQNLKSYYFYKAVVHTKVTTFKCRNYKLDLFFWRSLFSTVFSNLVSLNLALSCNDQILELIPIYCPNLEHLNATCKYERVDIGGNACTFALSVTDYGLSFLCSCKKLRTITVNEPRSNSRSITNGITYSGLRRLLIRVSTLEDISYSDLGSVIRKGLEHQLSLNLRIIRHFNATEDSIKEIIRLCRNLKELYLTFFNNEQQNSIWMEIIKSNLRLHALEVTNLNCKENFSELFKAIGESLVSLSISNSFCTITFSNLITIGRYCPNLTYFSCSLIVNEDNNISGGGNNNNFLNGNSDLVSSTYLTRNSYYDNYSKVPFSMSYINNYGQFSKLDNLHIHGSNMDIERILKFCTENAENLETIRIMEKGVRESNMDRIFPNCVPSKNLRHIEASDKLPFTTNGIRNLLKSYALLNYINVSCKDDSRNLLQEIMENNYDLIFVNKLFIPFQQV